MVRKGRIDQPLPGRKIAACKKKLRFVKGYLQKERETDGALRKCKASEMSGRE